MRRMHRGNGHYINRKREEEREESFILNMREQECLQYLHKSQTKRLELKRGRARRPPHPPPYSSKARGSVLLCQRGTGLQLLHTQ